MLTEYSTVLTRFGINVQIIDSKPLKTSAGKADGVQPKTMETFKQLELFHKINHRGVRVYDITMWDYSLENGKISRISNEVHFPSSVDLRDPYILLLHQGMVESMFLEDLQERNCEVKWGTSFIGYSIENGRVQSDVRQGDTNLKIRSKYLVGCDGAHSKVRKSMPRTEMVGVSTEDCWGVIDGELETDFPDFWTKTVVRSRDNGSILGIPRERNQTRLYVELDNNRVSGCNEDEIKSIIQSEATKILLPYQIQWNTVEWVGIYKVGQRVASNFSDEDFVFIVGDASHSHSPKAAQGMNVSMHDSWNLGWKLALTIKGMATRQLLSTYEDERKKIGHDLINFDKKHANSFKDGDHKELASDFEKNVKFISGIGATYNLNILNKTSMGYAALKPGELLLPADGIRYIDTNPVEIENAIPCLGQFRLYVSATKLEDSNAFLNSFSEKFLQESILREVSDRNPLNLRDFSNEGDIINRKRYTPISEFFSLALILAEKKYNFELSDLPPIFTPYKWSIFLEDNKNGPSCKWFPRTQAEKNDVKIVIVRPDGYVGAFARFENSLDSSRAAVSWINYYFKDFIVL